MVNAISSGVAFAAAKMMSPSFSRSSSSTTTTALPAAMSAIARSTESNRTPISELPFGGRVAETDQPLDVLGDDVDLEVHGVTGLLEAERGAGEGLRDQRDDEALVLELGDGQGDPVDGDGSVEHDVAPDVRGQRDLDEVPVFTGRAADDRARGVDVPLDNVPPEAGLWCAGALEVDAVPDRERTQGGLVQCHLHDVGGEGPVAERGDRQAAAVHSDRVAEGGAGGCDRALDGQPDGVGQLFEDGDRAELLDDSGEHVSSPLLVDRAARCGERLETSVAA